MESYLFSHDEYDQSETSLHFEDDGRLHVATQQDVTEIVDANKRAFNAASERWTGEGHRVASIPTSVYYDLKAKGIVDDPKAFRAWLNDPDNRVFRTRAGRV